MRINNDVRNYVRKAVDRKAETKRKELVDDLTRVGDEYRSLLDKKREAVKAKMHQLCCSARDELVKYAKSIGCKLVKLCENDFVSCSEYEIDRQLTADGERLVSEANDRLSRFDASVNEKVDEILFRLSLGGDYESIVEEINNIKF